MCAKSRAFSPSTEESDAAAALRAPGSGSESLSSVSAAVSRRSRNGKRKAASVSSKSRIQAEEPATSRSSNKRSISSTSWCGRKERLCSSQGS